MTTPCELLNDKIANSLIMTGPLDKSFLPRKDMDAFLSQKNLEGCLPNESDDLKQFVFHEAPKIFGILLYIRLEEKYLGSVLQEFRTNKFNDKSLPIPNLRQKFVCDNEAGKCNHHSNLNPFHYSPWRVALCDAFYRDQFIFLAPIFNEDNLKSRLQLSQGNILPLRAWKIVHESHFSNVHGAYLVGCNQDFFPEVRMIFLKLSKPNGR